MTPRFTKEQEDKWFKMAEDWSHRATCPRASVGVQLVTYGNQPLVGGFNGAPNDLPTCNDVGCLIEGGHCVRSVHAEMRALAYAARRGYRLDGTTAVVTLLPCINCLQAMALAGVTAVYYDAVYDREEKEHLFVLAEQLRVELIERSRA